MARETGLICTTTTEISAVAMLAVIQPLWTTHSRITAGKCAVIGSSRPWSGIDARICVAGNAVAQGSIEASRTPMDVIGLGDTGGVVAASGEHLHVIAGRGK